MSLIKPGTSNKWNIENETMVLYSNVSPLNDDVNILSENSVSWISSWRTEDDEEKNSFLAYFDEEDAFILSRKLMATLVPYQQDFAKNNNYSYSSVYKALYLKNTAGSKLISYENECMAEPSSIAIIYFINDDYEGGEIYLPDIDVTIHPKKNDLLIYPSEAINYQIGSISSGEQRLFCLFLD
jgi:hypothetical protein